MALVYKLTNTITGKSYVGMTKFSVNRRFKTHIDFKNFCVANGKKLTYFARAPNKYGEDCWKKEKVCDCDTIEDAYKEEIRCIEKFNTFAPNGYNTTRGGEGGHGRVMGSDQKEFLRKLHTGKTLSEKTKAKMIKSRRIFWESREGEDAKERQSKKMSGKNNPFYGKTHTKESNNKRKKSTPDQSGKNNSFYGKKHTEETKRQMSGSMPDRSGKNNSYFGKKHTEEIRNKMRKPRLSIQGDNHYSRRLGISSDAIAKMKATKLANGSGVGGKNPNARRCVIDEMVFDCIRDAAGTLNMTNKQIRYRLDSEKYNNFKRLKI